MLISEIAKESKVSPATVSRALNRPEIVAPATLARIRSVMEKHSYVPAPPERRPGPKTTFHPGAKGQRIEGAVRAGGSSLDLIETVTRSMEFYRVASIHQAQGGAVILRHPDGREERLLFL